MIERSVCSSCPFRVSNHYKRVPKGWYSEANLARLWRGVSEGRRLACTEFESVPESTPAEPTSGQRAAQRECAGALYLVLRHLEAVNDPSYVSRAKVPLSVSGLTRWRARLSSPSEVFRERVGDTLPLSTLSVALGVPWDCPVTNAVDATEDLS